MEIGGAFERKKFCKLRHQFLDPTLNFGGWGGAANHALLEGDFAPAFNSLQFLLAKFLPSTVVTKVFLDHGYLGSV